MSDNKRTALVSGSGQGMGLGVARSLAAQGIQVVINDIDPVKAEAAAKSIRADGGDALAFAFDVSKMDQVEAAIKELEPLTGGIDILVNNAGNGGTQQTVQLEFKDMPVENWDRYISVNFYGVLNCTKAVLAGMCDRGWGRVITISSEAGRVGLDINVSVYGAAKAGGAHLMRHVAKEVGKYGVTANVISLGLMNNVPAEFTAPLIKIIPARALGEPEDVAGAVDYLASDAAKWVTGQTLTVNGGVHTS